MGQSDLTIAAFLFKKLYSDGTGDIANRDHALLSRIAKQGGFVGTDYNYAIRYGNPQGISGTFANAQANTSSSQGIQLAAKRFVKYGLILINGEAAAASKDKGAFMDLVVTETDGVLEEMGDAFAFDLYRSGNGQRGQRLSAATNVITMADADTARNFKVGMTVIASANADGSSPRVGSTTVAGVDEDSGTVTLTSAAGITSFADNDFLFRQGDPGTCMEGLEVCIPLTAPTAGDSFRGKDRSVDARRLAGVRVNDTSTTIEENAGLVGVKIAQVGKKADEVYVNPIRFWQAARRANAKVMYQGAGGQADYGFEFIEVSTPAGTLKMFSDADCPTNRGRVVSSKQQFLKHLMDLPHIIMDDGRASLRSVSADSIEARARGWVNLIQPVPGSHGVFAI